MPKYYLLDENKNLVEGYDKEGFLALLEEAIENGDLEHIDEDSAFVSKFKSLLNGTTHHLEFVTQVQYNQLVADEELQPNTYYFITDDTTLEGFEESLNQFSNDLTSAESNIQNIINGTQVVGNATHAISADNATNATNATNAGSAQTAGTASEANSTKYETIRAYEMVQPSSGVLTLINRSNLTIEQLEEQYGILVSNSVPYTSIDDWKARKLILSLLGKSNGSNSITSTTIIFDKVIKPTGVFYNLSSGATRFGNADVTLNLQLTRNSDNSFNLRLTVTTTSFSNVLWRIQELV